MEEMEDLLGAEMFIDIKKLKEAAVDGIPWQLRGEVWKFLLGVSTPDQSQTVTQKKINTDDYESYDKSKSEVSKRLRGEIKRYITSKFEPFLQRKRALNLSPTTSNTPTVPYSALTNSFRGINHLENVADLSKDPTEKTNMSQKSSNNSLIHLFSENDASKILENVICTYINRHSQIQYDPGLVHSCAIIPQESDIYHCFERFSQLISEFYSEKRIQEQISSFWMLFRQCQPELFNYFEEEEVNMQEWTRSWFEFMLARELPIECLLRLWDTYLSHDDGFQLHPYVCLAILGILKENLYDSYGTEIKSTLLKLPPLDMEQIISQSFSLKNEILQKGLVSFPSSRRP